MEKMLNQTIAMLLAKLGGRVTLTREDWEKLSGQIARVKPGENIGDPVVWYLEGPGTLKEGE